MAKPLPAYESSDISHEIHWRLKQVYEKTPGFSESEDGRKLQIQIRSKHVHIKKRYPKKKKALKHKHYYPKHQILTIKFPLTRWAKLFVESENPEFSGHPSYLIYNPEIDRLDLILHHKSVSCQTLFIVTDKNTEDTDETTEIINLF